MVPLNDRLMANATAMLRASLEEVFSTMFRLSLEDTEPDGEPMQRQPLVIGIIGFNGNVSGVVCLHLTAAFAIQLTSILLGMPESDVLEESMVNDVVGEASNMIVGGMKSRLCGEGAGSVLTVPSIVRAQMAYTAPTHGAQQTIIRVRCCGNPILLTLQIKTEPQAN